MYIDNSDLIHSGKNRGYICAVMQTMWALGSKQAPFFGSNPDVVVDQTVNVFREHIQQGR